MKANTKVLALMTALAAGVAAAQNTNTDGTKVDTTINNVATASFTDPTSSTGATSTVDSNIVSTTVLPKPGFDIVYRDGTDGNTTTNANGNTATTVTNTTALGTVTPGGTLTTPYYVVNNGNTDQTITLATQPNTAYYLDANNNGVLDTGEMTPITSVDLKYDDPAIAGDQGIVSIIQVITVPTTATPGSTYAATPIGTGQTFNGTAPVTTTESATTLGLQYAVATVYTPVIDNNSTPSTTPTKPVDSDGNPMTPPTTTTVTPPGGTGTPGYTDPAGTPIVGLGSDNQIAYPKADADNNPDVVTFTNTVTNNGTADDKVQLFPVDPNTGTLLSGVTYDSTTGTFTYPDGTTVQFLDPVTHQPILAEPGALYPTVIVPAGSTAYYETKVTYPDPNDTALTTPIVINIGADSLSDAGVVSDSNTTDTIMPPAAQFGDTTTDPNTADPTLAPVQSGTPGSTVYFPMDLVNNGQYTDTFTLAGTVTFTETTTGSPVTVPVTYYVDTNGDGVLDPTELAAGPVTSVTLSAANPTNTGDAVDLIAAVTIPTTAVVTTTTTQPTLDQTATATYSTIVMKDTNDAIAVTASGNMAVAKFVQGGNGATSYAGLTAPSGYAIGSNSAIPTAPVNYAISAKNNYNTSVTNFFLTDKLNANLTYVSSSCEIILKDNTTQACTTTTVANADGTTTVNTSTVTLPQGATMNLFINTTVK